MVIGLVGSKSSFDCGELLSCPPKEMARGEKSSKAVSTSRSFPFRGRSGDGDTEERVDPSAYSAPFLLNMVPSLPIVRRIEPCKSKMQDAVLRG